MRDEAARVAALGPRDMNDMIEDIEEATEKAAAEYADGCFPTDAMYEDAITYFQAQLKIARAELDARAAGAVQSAAQVAAAHQAQTTPVAQQLDGIERRSR